MINKIKSLLKKSPKIETGEKQYSKFGIGFRLISAFSVVTALTILLSGLSWLGFDTLTSAQDKTIKQEVPAITKALKLANDTAQIAALAPQLGSSSSDEERQANITTLNNSINVAKTRLSELNTIEPDNPELAKIASSLQTFEPLIVKLDSSVKERLRLSKLRTERLSRLEALREILKKGASPLLFPLRMQMFNNADATEELVESIVENRFQGISQSMT